MTSRIILTKFISSEDKRKTILSIDNPVKETFLNRLMKTVRVFFVFFKAKNVD